MKSHFRHTFLARLYRFDRWLFIIVTGFFLFTVLANVLKAQGVPFFIWGMFSERSETRPQYKVLRVTVNDTTVIDYTTGYPDATRFYLYTPLAAYVAMRENNDTDKAIAGYPEMLKHHFLFYRKWVERTINSPGQYRTFLEWYARYLQEVTGNSIASLTIEWVYCHYDKGNKLQTDSSRVIDKSFF